jgi:CubicO group peptidase (beta-lactamase class C family)
MVPTSPPTASPATEDGIDFAWQAASPESQGIDSHTLAEMFQAIEQEEINLHSLMILRNDLVVLEAYFSPYTMEQKHVMFSITKSIMATLIGIAIEQGYIEGVDQRISELLPEASLPDPDPQKEKITLEDVLTMTSGLGWEETDRTFGQLYGQYDWLGYVLGKEMVADPGSRFSYCSGCSHILSGVLLETTGMNPLDFARENLFAPLGITDFRWETDREGLPIGGWGLELTTRDMAKLGILYLERGSWNGQQIVPAEWIDKAVEYKVGAGGFVGYGYQWWIYPEYNAYSAFGRGGQIVFVIPVEGLIIATTAETANHDPILALIEDFILPAVQSEGVLPENPEGEQRLQDWIAFFARPE